MRAAPPAEAVDIGSRRELFIDDFLLEKVSGAAALTLARPRDAGVALRLDRPWEGPFCGYATLLRDGDLFRLYYRGLPVSGRDGSDDEVTCCAESPDGIEWHRPALNLYEVHGARENNVVLAGMAPFSHNFAPFLDTRPGVPAAERFKALAGTSGAGGLHAFASADGYRWRRLSDRAVITEGAFDSQNVSFWSDHERCYVAYFRSWHDGIRRISRSTSEDFAEWSPPVLMEYGGRPIEHLYTNQTHPYFRAPHIYVALAARFMPGRQVVTPDQARELQVDPDYYGDCSDGVLLTSRGGDRYERTFMEGFIRPGVGLENWVSRTNYPVLGVIPTGASEMSLYANQNYGQPTAHIRRYTLRTDGFASLRASYDGGEALTRPLRFSGDVLSVNFATSAAGSVRVEIQDAAGDPLPDYSLVDSVETIGNEIERAVRWTSGPGVGRLAGRPVRLRFVLRDADLYSFRFQPA